MAEPSSERLMPFSEAARLYGEVLVTAGAIMERGIGSAAIDDLHVVPRVDTAAPDVQPRTHARATISAVDSVSEEQEQFELRAHWSDDGVRVWTVGYSLDDLADLAFSTRARSDLANSRVRSVSAPAGNKLFVVSPEGFRHSVGRVLHHAGSIALDATRLSDVKVRLGGQCEPSSVIQIGVTDVSRMQRARFDMTVRGSLVGVRLEAEHYRRGGYKLTQDSMVVDESGRALRWRRRCRIRGLAGLVDDYEGSERRFGPEEIGNAAERVARFAIGVGTADDVMRASRD